MLIPSENRERAAMFDFAVTAAHEALTHPDIAEPLGSLVTDLEIINKTAFLPDYRHGMFHIPPSCQHEPSTAIIPVADEVFDTEDLHKLMKPILDVPIRTWPFGTAFISDTYDLNLTQEAHALIAKHGKAVDPLFAHGDDITTMEAFAWQENVCLTKQKLYVTSRPVIMLRYSMLRHESEASVAAITIHEESHAVDLLINGPMIGILGFAVASELRANFTDYHVLAGYGQQITHNIAAIESLRRAENDGSSSPFRPTDSLTDFMVKNKLI